MIVVDCGMGSRLAGLVCLSSGRRMGKKFQTGCVTDYDDSRRLYLCGFRFLRKIGQRAANGSRMRRVAAGKNGSCSPGIFSGTDEPVSECWESSQPHENDERSRKCRIELQIRRKSVRCIGGVSGDDMEALADSSVCDRDSCKSRDGNGGGDAGNDFKGNSRINQSKGLFPAAAEDEGVPALEPDNCFSLSGRTDHHLINLSLRGGGTVSPFAHGDSFCSLRNG